MRAAPADDSDWKGLRDELDIWRGKGMTANFWARDDDAIAMTPQLDRLISLASTFKIEIGLAVIPSRLTPPLANYLVSGATPFYPMCHGWRHVNYGSPTRPSEFGPERPLPLLVDDAKSAFEEFQRKFVGVSSIFVPPFARISNALVAELPKLGFSGVSTGPTAAERRLSRICARFSYVRPIWRVGAARERHFDVHIDPFDWGNNRARPGRSIAREVVGYLRARRKAFVPADWPIGLLLHHLQFDETTWAVSDRLVETLCSHPAVAWPALRTILAAG